MKKTIIILTIFLLLSSSTLGVGIATYSLNRPFLGRNEEISQTLVRIANDEDPNYNPNDYEFNPEDIELEDDAFHGSGRLHFTEWWYFDAMFDNGYSAQMSIRLLSALNQGIVVTRLDIYKDGFLQSHNKRFYLMRNFFASKDVPIIRLAGKEVMNGYTDEDTGEWVYDLSFEGRDASANLRFVGLTKGWKAQLPGGDWWGVILPRADVTGIITVNENAVEVHGVGYHDHNWGVTANAGINFGWFWGKINSANYTMTWSNILKTRFINYPILVINELDGDYFSIKAENIEFLTEDFWLDRVRRIPHSFALAANNEEVTFYVNMEVIDVHHVRLMGMVNYWRYHIRCTGQLTIDTDTEPIDEIVMAELIRFR